MPSALEHFSPGNSHNVHCNTKPKPCKEKPDCMMRLIAWQLNEVAWQFSNWHSRCLCVFLSRWFSRFKCRLWKTQKGPRGSCRLNKACKDACFAQQTFHCKKKKSWMEWTSWKFQHQCLESFYVASRYVIYLALTRCRKIDLFQYSGG